MQVGRGLKSCTTEVASSRTFPIESHDVILLDTPGFDNTQGKDIQGILADIIEHLDGRWAYLTHFLFQ
jgi:hypothetical protein